MKKLIVLLIATLSMAGIAAYAQSLGDIAHEEQIRRDSITNSITIVLKSASPPVTDKETTLDTAENDEANQNGDFAKKAEPDENIDRNIVTLCSSNASIAGCVEVVEPEENTDLNGSTESYWRGVISDARNRVRQLEYDSTELTSRRNALQLQHDRTNGARRGPIKDEIERIRQSQENIRRDLEQARGELQSLLNEARSSGALPGWIE